MSIPDFSSKPGCGGPVTSRVVRGIAVLAASAAGALLWSAPATAEESGARLAIEEVVVTARKREERLALVRVKGMEHRFPVPDDLHLSVLMYLLNYCF